MTAQTEGTGADVAVAWLESLRARLRQRGWQAVLHTPRERPPVLDVTNPHAPQLSDRVLTGLGSDGQWWLWWSFAERIGPAADLDRAVSVITRVLAHREDG
jgi:hypothetical protein